MEITDEDIKALAALLIVKLTAALEPLLQQYRAQIEFAAALQSSADPLDRPITKRELMQFFRFAGGHSNGNKEQLP
jgi:hypothetical protein